MQSVWLAVNAVSFRALSFDVADLTWCTRSTSTTDMHRIPAWNGRAGDVVKGEAAEPERSYP